MEINGSGKKRGKEWKEEMEEKGYEVRERSTTDNYWGYRPIRIKQGVVDSIRVWASKNSIPGLWYYAIEKQKESAQ